MEVWSGGPWGRGAPAAPIHPPVGRDPIVLVRKRLLRDWCTFAGDLEKLDGISAGAQNIGGRQVLRHYRSNNGHHSQHVHSPTTSVLSENGRPSIIILLLLLLLTMSKSLVIKYQGIKVIIIILKLNAWFLGHQISWVTE